MAAGEDKAKPVVGEAAVAPEAHVVLLSSAVGEVALELGELQRLETSAPDPVERPVARGRGDPGTRVARNAIAWPGLERGHERVGERLLGEVEVAQDADERGKDAARFVAEGSLDEPADVASGDPALGRRVVPVAHMSTIGRTSIDP